MSEDAQARLRLAAKAVIDTLRSTQGGFAYGGRVPNSLAPSSLEPSSLEPGSLATHEQPPGGASFSLGLAEIDGALGGGQNGGQHCSQNDGQNHGLARGAVHEVYAPSAGHLAAAIGFATVLAVRAANSARPTAAHPPGSRPIVWVRQAFVNTETGALYALGLAELGLDPARLILVTPRDAEGVLRAGEQAAACGALGALLLEPWGNPKVIDFTASRRLSLAAAKSGVPIILHRAAAAPLQSAASTRWSVKAAASRALEANAPGKPAFELTLLRQRGGMAGQTWCVEWDRDRTCFEHRQRGGARAASPLSGGVVSMAYGRADHAGGTPARLLRTG